MRLTPPKRIALAAMILSIAVDQLTKAWLVPRLSGGRITVTPFFDLVQVWNHGVSFGMFNRGGGYLSAPEVQRDSLVLLTVVIVFALLHWLKRVEKKLPALALGLIIGGAIGNLADRFNYGAVADFLDFFVTIHNRAYHWPAFNVADSCIVTGVGLLLLDSVTAKDRSVPFASGD